MADSRRKLTLSAAAAARKRKSSQREADAREAWIRSDEGTRLWRECRAKAQAHADLCGTDVGIELLWNGGHPGLVSWSWFGLPDKHNRYGHETTCEVVHPSNLSRTAPGHGPLATRPPSTVGPDYHGGPWVGAERARELGRAWQKQWDVDVRLHRFVRCAEAFATALRTRTHKSKRAR